MANLKNSVKSDIKIDRCDSIRKQLLGVSYSGGRGYTSPTPEDVPLRARIEEHVGKSTAVA